MVELELARCRSGSPLYNLNGNAGVLGDKRLRSLHLDSHLSEFLERLLKLLTGGRVFSTGGNQLDRVEPCLLIKVIQQLNDLVKLVEIVDLNLSFLELGERGESAHCASSNLKDLICEHVTERRDRFSIDG